MKATEQYFPVVLFIMLYKVVLTFGSVDEILKIFQSIPCLQALFSDGVLRVLRFLTARILGREECLRVYTAKNA